MWDQKENILLNLIDSNCDIDGFGKYAVKYFPTIKDWQDYNWLDNYQNSTFNVNVETTIKSVTKDENGYQVNFEREWYLEFNNEKSWKLFWRC